MVYVSITGLELKSSRHLPRFWYHAVRSMSQAQTAAGNLSAQAKTVNGVHHTLSVWENEAAMRAYLVNGAHKGAMRSYRAMATGMTIGFATDQVPSWDEVPAIWLERGKTV